MTNTNSDIPQSENNLPEGGESNGLEQPEGSMETERLPAADRPAPPVQPEEIPDTLRVEASPAEVNLPPGVVPAARQVDTSPLKKRKPAASKTAEGRPRKKSRWLLFSFLSLLALLLVAALSGFGGYMSGISLRQSAASTQVSQVAREQYDLAVQEIQSGEYFRARQRLEYVIRLDPAYPGAVEQLADVLLELNTTATPTLVPTVTLTPTPDLRDVQQLYDQAQQFLLDGSWTSAIDALLALRKSDPEYRKVEVDGMLFIALRNSGRDKILKEIDLEGGIYDLTLASHFGLLDTEGQSLLNWSSLYITGASFWELDWGQAAYYFGQVAPHAPNLMDKSAMTAAQRYRIALVQYAKQLINQKNPCEAVKQLEIALSISQDGETQSLYDQALARCTGQTQPKPGTQTP
ncbi:MAG: hypothetical protein AB1894_08185 [Chloroflexota bacterium]